MNIYDAAETVIKKLYSKLGFQILNPTKGRVKIPTLQGEFVTFMTSDGFGFAPVDNPEDIHWTIHTKRKIPKETAFLHLLLTFFEEPAEFHEKVRGKITKKFTRWDGYTSFGKFVEGRRKEHKKRLND